MKREDILKRIHFAFEVTPCVAILGPRQCGKTTEAREYAKQRSVMAPQNYFDLESTHDVERLQDALLTLSQLTGLIVIDEIQAHPELFRTLRVLIDNKSLKQRYLILGSASRELIKQTSETLAGRITYIEMAPFSYMETRDFNKTWVRGGFPLAYLAKNDEISLAWRKSYIKTYLEQDIPKLCIQIPAENLRRFWMMLAQSQGSVFNASDIGRSLGLTHKTIQHYADILTGTFMIRQLKPWHENINKRQVKSPKIYIRDSGIYHALINVNSYGDLQLHPQLGHSWEGFAIEAIIRAHSAEPEDCYFWATHQGAELDLLLTKNNKQIGFEIKYTSSPTLTKSLRIAIENLKLNECFVVYPGDVDFVLGDGVRAVGLRHYLQVFS